MIFFPTKILAKEPKMIMKASVLLLTLLIRLYQLSISPWLPPSCRFHPSCSQYSIDALKQHGFFVGIIYTFYRIIRCQPWGGSGFDPVPEKPFTKIIVSIYQSNTKQRP